MFCKNEKNNFFSLISVFFHIKTSIRIVKIYFTGKTFSYLQKSERKMSLSHAANLRWLGVREGEENISMMKRVGGCFASVPIR